MTLLRPHGLQPARLLCPWGFPAKKTGAGCHLLLQGIFPTQGSNPRPLHWQVNSLPLSHQGSPFKKGICLKILFSPHIPQRSYFIGEEMEVQKTCGQNHRISSLQNSDQVFFSVYQEVSLWENRLKKKKGLKILISANTTLGGSDGKEGACSAGDSGWVGKCPWSREWQLTPVFLPGGCHGQEDPGRPRGRKGSDMTERLTHTQQEI